MKKIGGGATWEVAQSTVVTEEFRNQPNMMSGLNGTVDRKPNQTNKLRQQGNFPILIQI
jgi:hypothetical protein